MAINTIGQLRSYYPELADAPDDAIIDAYSQETGASPSAVQAYLGSGITAAPAEVDSDPSDVANALATYGNQMTGLTAGAGALVADSVGATGVRDSLLESYRGDMDDMAARQRKQYELEYLRSDEATAGDYVDAAQYYGTLGLANLGGALATGGLGSVVGKQVAKQGLKKYAGREASEAAMERLAGRAARKGAERGFYGGVGASAMAQEIGATFGQAVEEQEARGNTVAEVDNLRAFLGGAAAGSLEFASDVFLLGAGKFLPKSVVAPVGEFATSGNRAVRGLKGFGVAAPVEALTEAGQTILEDVGADTEVDLGDIEYRNKLLQAAFAGAAAGGIAGGTVSAFRGDSRQTDDLDDTPEPPTPLNPEVDLTSDSESAVETALQTPLGVYVADEVDPITSALNESSDEAISTPSGVFIPDADSQLDRELSTGEFAEFMRGLGAALNGAAPKTNTLPVLRRTLTQIDRAVKERLDPGEVSGPYVMLANKSGEVTRKPLHLGADNYSALVEAAAAGLSRRGGRKATQVETLTTEPDSITPNDTVEKDIMAQKNALVNAAKVKEDKPKTPKVAVSTINNTDPIFQTEGGRTALNENATESGQPNKQLQLLIRNYRTRDNASLQRTIRNGQTSAWKKAVAAEVVAERGGNVTAAVQATSQEPVASVPEVSLSSAQELFDLDSSDLGLNEIQTQVWEHIKATVANDEFDSIVSISGKNTKSMLSGKEIARRLFPEAKSKDAVRNKGKRVNDALRDIRKKVEATTGVDMFGGLATLNVQRNKQAIETSRAAATTEESRDAQLESTFAADETADDGAIVIAAEGEKVGGILSAADSQVADEVARVETEQEAAYTQDESLDDLDAVVAQEEQITGYSVRGKDKGAFTLGFFSGRDQKQIRELMARPEVDSFAGEKYAQETGMKDWGKLSAEQKENWFTKPDENLTPSQEREAIDTGVQEALDRQARERQEMLDLLAKHPTWKNIPAIYDRMALDNPNESLHTPFADLDPRYQELVVRNVTAEVISPQGIRRGVEKSLQEIAYGKQDEANQRAARQQAAGREIGADAGQTQNQPSDTGTVEVSTQQRATQKAEELAKEGKIKTKRRRVQTIAKSGAPLREFQFAGKPENGMTRAKALVAANRMIKSRGWRNEKAPLNLQVVETFADLPKKVQDEVSLSEDALGGVHIIGDVDGVSTVYLIADMHANELELESTLAHEMVHVAAQAYFEGNGRFETAAIALGMGRDNLMSLAEKFGVKNALLQYESDYARDGYTYAVSQGVLFEEMLAYTVGTGKDKGIINRIKAAVGEFRQWARSMGWLRTSELGETETLALIRRLYKTMQDRGSVEKGFWTPDGSYSKLESAITMELDQAVPLNAIATEGGQSLVDELLEGTPMDSLRDELLQVMDNAVASGRYEYVNDQGNLSLRPVEAGWDGNSPTALAGGVLRQQKTTSMLGALSDKIADHINEAVPGLVNAYQKGELGFMTMEQIANFADRVRLAAVRTYVDAVHQIQRTSKEILADAHAVNITWSRLRSKLPKQVDTMHQLMLDTTLEEFDPSIDTPATAKQQKLKATYDNLNSEVQDLYTTVRDEFMNWHKEKISILKAAILDAQAGGNAPQLEKLKGDLESMQKLKGPYFPLKRMNRYYSVGMSTELKALMDANDEAPLTGKDKALMQQLRKDPAHYIVESHKSVKDARDRSRRLKRTMGASYHQESMDMFKPEVNDIPDIATIEGYFQNSDLTPETKGRVKEILQYMYADMLPANSAAKSQMKREGVAGADSDMQRVFSDSAIRNAHQISRLKHAKETNDALRDVRDMATRQDMGDTTRIRDEVVKRANMVYEHENSPIADAVMTGSFFAHLGLSPAYVLTNVSQVPMITLPWLAARQGRSLNATFSAVTKAYADAAKIIYSNYSENGWRAEFDWEGKVTGGESRMLHDLLAQNKLDVTIEHDLTATAEGSSAFSFDRSSDFIQIANLPVRVTELNNRAVTALAAYRLEMQSLKNNTKLSAEQKHAAATEYAIQAVNETQLDYSGLNTPRYMQKVLGSRSLGKVMFQFRKYQQGMVYLVMKNAKDAMGRAGVDAKRQAEARNTLFGLFTTTGLMAGAAGTPLAGTIAWLANAAVDVFGEDDEPFDAELALREYISNMFGGGEDGAAIARAVMNGIPTQVGVDISKRIGMGDILFPLPFIRDGSTPRETLAEALIASLGAAPSYGINAVDGGATLWEAYQEGDEDKFYKGAAKIVPIKGVQNAIKGWNLSEQGLTERSGEPVLEADEFTAFEVLMRATGFMPSKLSDYYTANARRAEIKTAVTDARNDLLRRYAQAKLGGNDRKLKAVKQEIREFNQRNKHRKGTRITGQNQQRAVMYRGQARRDRTDSGLRGGGQYQGYNDDVEFITGAQR